MRRTSATTFPLLLRETSMSSLKHVLSSVHCPVLGTDETNSARVVNTVVHLEGQVCIKPGVSGYEYTLLHP